MEYQDQTELVPLVLDSLSERDHRPVPDPRASTNQTSASLENEELELALDKLAEIKIESGGETDKFVNAGAEESISSSESQLQQTITIGTSGIRSECITNFVRLIKSEKAPVYEYQVSFIPTLEQAKIHAKIIRQLEKVIGPVHNIDEHVLYLPKKLNNEITVINCLHPTESAEEVKVIIKFIKENLIHELCHFYDILFERVMTSLGFLRIKRGFYEMATAKQLQSHNLQVWPGVSVTTEFKKDGLMVMVDTPRRIFRTDTVYDYYSAMVENETRNLRAKFSDFLIGKIIICNYNQKCYKVDDVAWDLNPLSEFEYKTGRITFKDYYLRQYGIRIEHLEQPMLVSRIKPRATWSDVFPEMYAQSVVLVPELCCFTRLTTEQRRNGRIMSEITAMSKLIPILRINLIKSLVNRMMDDELAQSILAEWGLSLDRNPIRVEGREILPPRLEFNTLDEGKIVEPNFSKDAGQSCYHPVEVTNFVVLCTKHDQDKVIREFIPYYKEACLILGIRVGCSPNIIVVKDKEATPAGFADRLRVHCIPGKVQFVLVICPTVREEYYRTIKNGCTNVHYIPSQVILSRTLRHKSIRKIALNVCIQINCKLGGVPWALRMPSKKIMFIGMDVAHDPTRKNPSVIALIASMNDKCTRYFSRANQLPIHQEVATCLRVMFIDALSAYKIENGGEPPDHIIFYRDGGNAGSFEKLKHYEVDECLEVLREENSKTNFSYICVAKRIPQRIMHFTTDRNIENAKPGTVIDKTITQPHLYDFYIVSQLSQHGTTTPTHYTVLYETNPTPPDLMQKLAYSMTYMYYNYQGTIKVPAVIQYAHKLGQYCSRTKSLPSRKLQKELFYL